MRSKLEEQVADLLEELDVEYQYESEKISYMIEAQYIPDFKVGMYTSRLKVTFHLTKDVR